MSLYQQSPRRYFGGRMSGLEVTFLNSFILLNVGFTCFVIVFYSYVIPYYIQYSLDNPSPSNSETIVKVSKIAVYPLQENGFSLGTKFQLFPVTSFPVNVGIGPLNVNVKNHEKSLFEFQASGGSIWLNRPNLFTPAFNFTFSNQQTIDMHGFVRDFSNQELADRKITLEFCPEIKLYGMTMYSSLCLHYKSSIADLNPRLHDMLPSILAQAQKNQVLADHGISKPSSSLVVFEAPDTQQANAALSANFGSEQLSSLSSDFKFRWERLDIKADDHSLSFEFVAQFVNPTVFEVTKIQKIQFFVELQNFRVAIVSIENLGLSPSLNDGFDLKITLAFLNSESLDPEHTRLAIESVADSYSRTGDFEMAVSGPVNITAASFINKISTDFKFTASYLDAMKLMSSQTTTQEQSMVSSIIKNSNISFSVTSENIQTSLGLKIPHLSTVKPPLNYSFPFFLGFDLYGPTDSHNLDQLLIKTVISPVLLQKSDEGLSIQTNITISPENTMNAANSLANVINPTLASLPTASKVGFKGFSLSDDGKVPFQWCQEIFNRRMIELGIPGRTVSGNSSLFEAGSPGGESLKVLGNVHVAQLSDVSGFDAKGSISVPYPESYPEIHIDVGYISIASQIDEVDFLGVEMPQGIHFYPKQGTTLINARAVLARNSKISEKVKSVADSFFNSDSAGQVNSNVSLGGFLFGPGGSRPNIVTFSKIIYQMNLDDLTRTSANTTTAPSESRPLMKVDAVDLQVKSASDVSIALNTVLNNPYPVSLSIGSIHMNALLDDLSVMGMVLSPLDIKSGSSPLQFNVNLIPQVDDGNLADKVGKFINSISTGSQSDIMAGITGLKLVKEGVSTIDQFENVMVQMPSSKLVQSHDSPSMVDYSALTSFNSSLINPQFQNIEFKALPGLNLFLGADISYSNPAPIALNIPFLQASAILNQMQLVDAHTSYVLVKRDNGAMKPRVNLKFNNQPGLPEVFASSMESMKHNQENVGKYGIKGFYFGSSPNDKNGIFSKVSIDITSKIMQNMNGNTSKSYGISPNVSLNSADVQILPASTVGFNADLRSIADADFKVSIPFIRTLVGVDNVQSASINVGINARSPSATVSGHCVLNDSEELAQKVANVYSDFQLKKNTLLNAKFRGILLGASADDAIQLFSGLSFDKQVDLIDYYKPGKSDSSSFATLSQISLLAKPAKTIGVDGNVKVNNSYPISVSGLGFIETSVVVDSVPFLAIKSKGFNINKGDSSFNASMDTVFPSSEEIKSKIAVFGKKIMTQENQLTEAVSFRSISFGVNEKDRFSVFSKVVFDFDYKPWIPASSSKESQFGRIFSLSMLDLGFNPSKIIDARIEGKLNTSYQASVNIPYISLSGHLDHDNLFDIDVNNLSFNSGNPTLNMTSKLHLQDSEPLSDKIGNLYRDYSSGKSLEGSILGSAFQFGIDGSAENVIDTFSKLELGFKLDRIREQYKSAANEESNMNLSLEDIRARTEPKKAISISLLSSFASSYPIRIQRLGFTSVGMEINNVHIFDSVISGLSLMPNLNKMNLTASVAFKSGDIVSDAVSSFYNAYGTVSSGQSIFGTGLLFGYDSINSFSLLSKCKFDGSNLVSGNSSSSNSIFKYSNMTMEKVHLKSLPEGQFALDLGAVLKNVTFEADAAAGFIYFTPWLDDKRLADINMPNGFGMSSALNKDLSFQSKFLMSLHNDAKQDMSVLFNKYRANEAIPSSMSVSNLLIGFDQNPENIIDAFSRISLRRNVSDYLVKSMEKSSSPSSMLPEGFSYKFDYMDLDLFDDHTFISKLDVFINPGNALNTLDLYVDLPYLSGSLLYNTSDFLTFSLLNSKFENGRLNTSLLIHSHGNKAALNRAFFLVGLVEANKVPKLLDSMTAQSFSFGYNKNLSCDMFSLMARTEPVQSLTDYFTARSSERFLVEYRVILQPEGGETEFTLTTNFTQFNNKLQIDFKSNFQANQTGPITPLALYKVKKLGFPKTLVLITPDMANGMASLSTKRYIDRFATDYLAADSLFGYFTFTSSDGKHIFTDMNESFCYGLEGSPWAPYIVDVMTPNTWKWNTLYPGYLDGPIRVRGKFQNNATLHLDMGDAYLNINVGGEPLVSIRTTKPLVIVNYLEGGAATSEKDLPVMGELGFFWPSEYYGFFWLAKIIGKLQEAHRHPERVTYDYAFLRNGTKLDYINQVLDHMPSSTDASSVTPCYILSVLHLQINDRPDSDYPLLISLEHRLNQMFTHCDFSSNVAPLSLDTILQPKISNSTANSTISGLKTLSNTTLPSTSFATTTTTLSSSSNFNFVTMTKTLQ